MKQPAHNCALIVETKKKCFIIVWFIEPRMWQRAKTTPNNIPGATTKTRKRSESEAWCRFDGKASCFPSFRKSKQKSFFRSPFPRPISWWPGRQKNKSMRSIDVKYLRWGWNSVDSLRIFFCCFCFRLCVFTMLFQVVHRSLNRPQSAMDWFTLVTSTLRLFFLRSPVTHIIAKKKRLHKAGGNRSEETGGWIMFSVGDPLTQFRWAFRRDFSSQNIRKCFLWRLANLISHF